MSTKGPPKLYRVIYFPSGNYTGHSDERKAVRLPNLKAFYNNGDVVILWRDGEHAWGRRLLPQPGTPTWFEPDHVEFLAGLMVRSMVVHGLPAESVVVWKPGNAQPTP